MLINSVVGSSSRAGDVDYKTIFATVEFAGKKHFWVEQDNAAPGGI